VSSNPAFIGSGQACLPGAPAQIQKISQPSKIIPEDLDGHLCIGAALKTATGLRLLAVAVGHKRAAQYDLVLRGGRVIDPESGLDAAADVAVSQGRITDIGSGLPSAPVELDATGHLVSAGFVDLHSHVTDVAGMRLRALDGVTTAFELEGGITPVGPAYRQAAAEGRPINYGFAASWALARMEAVGGIHLDAGLGTFMANISAPQWQGPATQPQISQILATLSADLADGALGIGMLVGYAPGADPDEYLRVARLAAQAGAPTFTHARDLTEFAPSTLIDGAEEIVRAAAETGAHMHYCHLNSTSLRHVDRVLEVVGRAQAAGSRVTTEAYPYGCGMTGIGAAFLSPERLPERGLTPSDLTYAPTGEQVGTEERLRELRATDPGGLVIIRHLDEDNRADQELMLRPLLFPDAVVASDAMPLTWTGPAPDQMTWPLPGTVFTHPRTAGTFSRALRMLATGDGPLGWTETLRRCSLLPAQLLQTRVPAMRRKGRIQAGCDADIVVLDPATISDQATYSHSTRPPTGIRHVLVNGIPVVRDAAIQTGALPGQPVRAAVR
jgi:N-acyl-D-aspartate/D-glutamate deacylase